MPLQFSSINKGQIAFGFFNIETDMLLLENYFFFADKFSEKISFIAKNDTEKSVSSKLDIYKIENKDVGNLMNAIYGISFTGFIGDVYRRFPFPKEPDKFKQNPEGFKTCDIIKSIIEKYADKTSVAVLYDKIKKEFKIGEYLFEHKTFLKLIEYVLEGGYPKWKNGLMPDYVAEMKADVKRGLNFSIFSI